MNYRKEFFRINLEEIREAITGLGFEPKFTMMAEAAKYRQTLAIDALPAQQRTIVLDSLLEEEMTSPDTEEVAIEA